MTFKSKVKVTVTFSTRKAYNSAVLTVRTLRLSRDVGPHQEMNLRVNRTLHSKKLDNLAMLGDRTLKLRRDVGHQGQRSWSRSP